MFQRVEVSELKKILLKIKKKKKRTFLGRLPSCEQAFSRFFAHRLSREATCDVVAA